MKSTMKVDARIKQIIFDAVASKHRALFMIIGDNAKKQIPVLHHIALRAGNRTADSSTILWLYKEDRDTCSRKQLKQLQRKINCGQFNFDDNDPFDLFLVSNIFHHCHYNDTQRVLGQTYGMCILQDFSALTPNILARAIETVCGGGLIIFLLPSVQNLHQVFEMSMDVHSHYRTESHPNVKPRFNKRFLLSLANCANAMVTDDQLNILLISAPGSAESALYKEVIGCDLEEISRLSGTLEGEEVARRLGPLLKCCRTLDQAVAVTKFIRALSNRTSPSAVVTTAARGRGKSAALGLGLASAVALGFSRILVTAPSPENVSTLFDFLCQGLDILDYEAHQHYEVTRSDLQEFGDSVVNISIFKDHPQMVKYIQPGCHDQLGQPDIVCIDEAAAIPLPVLKKLIGPYFVFMSSTINGYEGTGRSLSLKLINDMRQQSVVGLMAASNFSSKHQQQRKVMPDNVNRMLCEVSLQQPIRYSDSDPVESWLYDVLCLDICSNLPRSFSTGPPPAQCQLFYVQRDTLFSYNRKTEEFLKHLVAIYVSSHYKNSPNDLQLLADAPAHHIFCLLGPDAKDNELPEIFCVLQVAFEGKLSVNLIQRNLERGERASGDMIPWTIEQQFEGHSFAGKSGLRIVRIATHPDYQRMGYGSRALQLLQDYFEGKVPRLTGNDVDILDSERSVSNAEVTSLLNEMMKPQRSLPPLLVALGHRPPESLDYFGVSFGVTPELLKFWRKFGMLTVYVRQTSNDLTGEHSCIMVKSVNSTESVKDDEWLKELWAEFRKRFLRLLSHDFRSWHVSLAFDLLHHQSINISMQPISSCTLQMFITQSDMLRLEKYSNNLVDYRLIKDLVQPLASLYFCRHLDLHLNAIKSAILLGIGLQGKSIDDLVIEFNSKERNFSAGQVLAILSQTVRRLLQSLRFCSQKAKERDNLQLEQSREQTSPTIKEIPNKADRFDKNQLQRKRKYNKTEEKDEQNNWKCKRTM